MKTKHVIAIIVFLLAAMLIYAGLKGIGTGDEKTSQSPLPFVFEEATTTYHVSVDIPKTDNESLNKSIRRYAESRMEEFAEMYGPEAFTQEELEFLGFNDGRYYELIIGGTPWKYDTLSGMIVDEYSFTGGAHGGTTLAPFMYDEKGRALDLSELFDASAAYLERIAESLRPRLKDDLMEKNIFVEDMFMSGTAPDSGNYEVFSLGEDGITFYFNEYQVAPYAAGISTSTVPFDELRAILSPRYFE